MKQLEIKDLTIHYVTQDGTVKAVNNISLEMEKGETLGLVGETGAGKTTTALAMMNLIPDPPGRVINGQILFEGDDVLLMSKSELHELRGNKIAMIFQDPMTALNPVLTVEEQLAEIIKLHQNCSRSEARKKAGEALEQVGIPAFRGKDFPHQFSGGMKQRVVIAIALSCNPSILIADEPTTALDVTIQAQILEMMNELKVKLGTSMLLITHDLGVVAETCDRVAIMYAGEIVEQGTVSHIFRNMMHPYTIGLFDSLPSLDSDVERLKPIPGYMPDPTDLPVGCKFGDRCPLATEKCKENLPELTEVEEGHLVRCWRCTEKGEKIDV